MPNVEAGRLRHQIALQSRVDLVDSNGDAIQDQNGQQEYVWQTIATPRAAVEPLSAREFIAAQASQSKVVARITIRHRTNIDFTMRFLFRGKVYNIEGILPDRDSGVEYLTIPVSYGVNDTGE